MKMEPIYFVHMSDTHIGETADYSRNGHASLPCAERAVEIINNLPQKPDFVMHTGDVVADPHPDSYARAAKVFAKLNVPIYYAVGNHDTADDICHYLTMGECKSLADKRLDYTFDVRGYRFLVLDGSAPRALDPNGILYADQLARVREEVANGESPLTVFVHFPAHKMNAPWLDGNMPLLNGDAFHQALLPAKKHLRGVFSGHIHQNMQITKDGITYTSVASTFSQFASWPQDVDIGIDSQHPPSFNFVTYLPDQTIVRQHTFERP